jgi:hypothetical protein
MCPDREEALSLGEVCPVVAQVCPLVVFMLAVVAEDIDCWKS